MGYQPGNELDSGVNVYFNKITSQCNFSHLNYKNKLALGFNPASGLEPISFHTDLWISPGELWQVPRRLPDVPWQPSRILQKVRNLQQVLNYG